MAAGEFSAAEALQRARLSAELAYLMQLARDVSELAMFMRPRVKAYGPTPVLERTEGLAQELEAEVGEVLERAGVAA